MNRLDELYERLYYSFIGLSSILLIGYLSNCIKDLQLYFDKDIEIADNIIKICIAFGIIIIATLMIPSIIQIHIWYYHQYKKKGHH